MNERMVFHLGFPKCASTFLKKQVFPNLQTYAYVDDRAASDVMITHDFHELPEVFALARRLNRLSGGILERLVPSRGIDITAKFAEGVLSQYRSGNRKLSDFFGLGLERYGYF